MAQKEKGVHRTSKKPRVKKHRTMGEVVFVIRLWTEVEIKFDCEVCPKNGKCPVGFAVDHKVRGCGVRVVKDVAEGMLTRVSKAVHRIK